MLFEAAIPADVREETSAKLSQIIEEYLKELLTLPVEKYGVDKLDIRREFARRNATVLIGKGPASLEDDTVQEILAIAFADDELEVKFTANFYEELERVVVAGLAAGIDKFLQAVEIALANLPNEALAGLSVNESCAETFRMLSDEFTGTFDELVEVARTL